jgi:hypothetical protein
MKTLRTPFPTTGYHGPEYFCDREEELATLIRNMERGGQPDPEGTGIYLLQLQGDAFISQHSLGNPATVLRSLKSLQKMQLVYRETDGDGNSYYGIYDILFRRWIDKKTL